MVIFHWLTCYPGQLNQVFMNLLSNAIDALEEPLVGENKENLTFILKFARVIES